MKTYRTLSVLCLLAVMSGCVQSQYYWGDYEGNLYARQKDPGQAGEAQAIAALEAIFAEAAQTQSHLAPGLYLDYAYLLAKHGRPDDALAALEKEVRAYPESKPFADRMTKRINERRSAKKSEEQVPR